ncbi:cupin-like domain-containing protein [Trichoderma austrokoningii]
MTLQPLKDDPDLVVDKVMAIVERHEISTASNDTSEAPVSSSIERQRTGSTSRSGRFPASLVPGQSKRGVFRPALKRLLPGHALRTKKASAIRSKTERPLDSSNSSNGRRGTSESSRLGTLQLGKYAHEEEMPPWLIKLLEKKGAVRASGVIPALKHLLELSEPTEYAYLCHPDALHGEKKSADAYQTMAILGGFCGYRNIQVLAAHIIGTQTTGWQQFGDDIPSIFQIQDLIETAWDRGYNVRGRIETGGIRGTRKYIGTPEAQALFRSMEFPCSVQAFRTHNEQDNNAASRLLQAIERYFEQGAADSSNHKVRSTHLPPIYLQRPSHSVTIVGLEKLKDGHVQLLVFDPEFQSSEAVTNLATKVTRRKQAKINRLLEPYRRSDTHLERFKEFELFSEPSPLEFMRYVARNTPFVIRGGASHWKATQKWNSAYLKSALDGQSVNVAVTPFGNADAPTFSSEHEATVISKPHEELQQFSDFFTHVTQQETDPEFPSDSEVRYAQTHIPFARIALEKAPDAINLWIGNSRSTTALHKDNFENIFVQIVGRKHFVLLPPLFHACVNERPILPATYVRQDDGFALRLDSDSQPVPLATWDPDDAERNATPVSALAKPLRVTLNPGDMLYLPAMWYHKVKQSCISGGEGYVLAVNYWYDMDFSGPLYPMTSFLRELGTIKQSMCHADESKFSPTKPS